MNAFIAFIQSHIWEWIFAAMLAALTKGYHGISKRLKSEQQKNEAIAQGMQCLLRESIVGAYNKYSDKGYCPIYAKESIKSAYKAYHDLGGNDVATELYNKILKMEEEPKND